MKTCQVIIKKHFKKLDSGPILHYTHTPGFGMFDEAAFSGRLKHSWPVLFLSLVVFLSFCIPRRGAGVCPGRVCACALVLCLHASLSPLSVTGFCDLFFFFLIYFCIYLI